MPSPDQLVAAIVVAGGSGSRFGGHKQFVELDGVAVAERSVAACRSVASRIVLVAPPGVTETYGADAVVAGGTTRAASVRAGLDALDADTDVIVVHDAARPLASPRLFTGVVAALDDEGVDGAICALELTDTIKRVATVDGRRLVVETLDRGSLVAVQTPQAFRGGILRAAHAGGDDATDDAGLVEAVGGIVTVVEGEPGNLKLTSPVDLAHAERLLEER